MSGLTVSKSLSVSISFFASSVGALAGASYSTFCESPFLHSVTSFFALPCSSIYEYPCRLYHLYFYFISHLHFTQYSMYQVLIILPEPRWQTSSLSNRPPAPRSWLSWRLTFSNHTAAIHVAIHSSVGLVSWDVCRGRDDWGHIQAGGEGNGHGHILCCEHSRWEILCVVANDSWKGILLGPALAPFISG